MSKSVTARLWSKSNLQSVVAMYKVHRIVNLSRLIQRDNERKAW